jgi:hypothetical protein
MHWQPYRANMLQNEKIHMQHYIYFGTGIKIE